MNHDHERQKLFTRRVAMLGVGKLVFASALAARMYYLQVIEAAKYRTLAEENRISLRLLPPPRGRILDRNGVAMAVNQQNFRVLVISEQTGGLERILDSLSKVIPLSDYERSRVMRDAKRRRSFVPVTVRENLSWEEVARIEVNAPDLPGVMIDVGQSRNYPLQGLGAHILGYVSAVSEADLQNSTDPLLELPGFRIGKAGVEKVYDMALRGRGGTSQVEVNAVGRVIRELAREEGLPGLDLPLTLDTELQEYAAQRLGEESAAVVVMDIHTGAVLVMASNPSFDPNAFNRGLSSAEWKELTTNLHSPLTNKAIAGQYAPGSTFKPMVALAGLEYGAITPEQRIFCPGYMALGNMRFHCYKKGGHGALDMVNAIKHSCDVYFYELARRVGVDRIADVAKRFGLGKETGMDLPNERAGVIPSRAWKQATLGQGWFQGETLINGIGQGYVLSTPLQLATMAARLANGGYAVTPHVVRDLLDGDRLVPRPPPDFKHLGINPKHLLLVRKGMNAVTNEAGGTAFRARINIPGMEMSGKSGTAQVRRISTTERDRGVKKNEDLPWLQRDHALFIAYAPEDAPRWACAAIVEHGGGGSAVAAPIARDILIEVQKNYPRSGPVATTPVKGGTG